MALVDSVEIVNKACQRLVVESLVNALGNHGVDLSPRIQEKPHQPANRVLSVRASR